MNEKRSRWHLMATLVALFLFSAYQIVAIQRMQHEGMRIRVVVEARRSLPRNARLTMQDIGLGLRRVPVLNEAVDDISVVEGRFLAVPVKTGQTLFASMVADRPVIPPERKNLLLVILPLKTISDVSLLPGDRIDVWGISGEPRKAFLIQTDLYALATAPASDGDRKEVHLYVLVPHDKVEHFLTRIGGSESLMVVRRSF